jgi:hypothetical protein
MPRQRATAPGLADLRESTVFKLTICIAMDSKGRDCRASAVEGAPFPICLKHLRAAFVFYADYLETNPAPTPEIVADVARMPVRNYPTPCPRESLVYYVAIGSHVKIGFTTAFADRMTSLQPDEILATEPGDSTLERERHSQFSRFRAPKGREYFYPAPELMAHIEMLRAQPPATAPHSEVDPGRPGWLYGEACGACELKALHRKQANGEVRCMSCGAVYPPERPAC